MAVLSETARRQGELWGRAARDWVAILEPLFTPIWEAALDAVQIREGTKLLDAGCGAGGAALLAKQRGADVYGIDASVAMLTIARQRLPHADLRLGELEDLPFPNATFDAAVAVNSVQFASDPGRAVHELARVCGTGRRVAILIWDSPEFCDTRYIFEAIVKLYAEKPAGLGPFALSAPGMLESACEGALRIANIRAIDCPFEYEDVDTALLGQLSTGPSQRAIEVHGEEAVSAAIREVLQRFVGDDRVLLRNRFKLADCVVA